MMATGHGIFADGYASNLAPQRDGNDPVEQTEKMAIYQGVEPPENGSISKEESLIIESEHPVVLEHTLIHFTSGSTVIPASLNDSHSFHTIIRPPYPARQ